MKVVTDHISVAELKEMSKKMFGALVKAVVDVERRIMVVDAELHSDQEYFLLEDGSLQDHLWGINLFPDKFGQDGFIVFDSMINLRPGFGNTSRGVDNPRVQQLIKEIVTKLVVL